MSNPIYDPEIHLLRDSVKLYRERWDTAHIMIERAVLLKKSAEETAERFIKENQLLRDELEKMKAVWQAEVAQLEAELAAFTHPECGAV